MHAAAHPDRFRREVPDEAVARAFAAAIEAPSSYWVVAEEEGETVGFLSAEFREREESWHSVARRGCYLAGIAVAPRFRRTGIARALVADLRREAAARGEVLRFVGRVDRTGKASVGLHAYPATHPFARIQLTDNIVLFRTSRYRENPLVVQGPGAGREVTAAGAFADLLRLASYLGAPL